MLKLLAAFHDQDERHNAAKELAAAVGASYLIIFIRDPSIDSFLPAPGFTKTLHGMEMWDNFLTQASKATHCGELYFPDGNLLTDAVGFPGPKDSVVVFLGIKELPQNISEFYEVLPLLSALLIQEQAVQAKKSLALIAQKETVKAAKLAARMEVLGNNLRQNLIEQQKDKEAIKLLMQKKDEFMNIASHELKTPITSMKAYLQLIAHKLLPKVEDPKLADFIEKSNKQADKLAGLVNDLLDVSKIQAGKMPFNLTEFDLNDVIRDSIDEANSISQSHHITLSTEKFDVVLADRMRIEQVLSNFLSNAIKYSPDGGEILLEAEHQDGMIKVTVTDHGIGVSADHLPYIFDRFFRVQPNDNKFFGLGLGLFISAEIIKRHNGTVGVASPEGGGAQFWFTLPVASQQKSPAEAGL